MTVFDTPLVTPLLRWLALAGMKISRWRLDEGEMGTPQGPCVLIGAPHTSNLDFLLMLAAVLSLRMHIHWFGKHTLFRFPFGPLMRWLGGIAIDRTVSHNAVEAAAAKFHEHPDLILVLAPEGTRSRVERWKSGFYHIARLAGVPVTMVGIDAEHRALRLLGQYWPDREDADEVHAAIEVLREKYFSGMKGIRPDRH